MKKTIILAIVLITLYSCSNQNVNPNDNPQLTPQECIVGKWWFYNHAHPELNNPDFYMTITSTVYNDFEIKTISDSVIYYYVSKTPLSLQRIVYKCYGDSLHISSNNYQTSTCYRVK